jgi:hypothetical protein
MVATLGTIHNGGRLVAAVVAAVLLQPVTSQAAPSSPSVTVAEERSVYHVVARFVVDGPLPVVLSVLTDYEQIPRFMPDVRTSVVRQHTAGRAIVEQEAVSEIMMFSKRIHLVLEVEEQPEALHFRDICQTSFTRYEGTWRVTSQEGETEVVYELTAQPSFGVPGFVLKRLLRRDSARMLERLQHEIESRSKLP